MLQELLLLVQAPHLTSLSDFRRVIEQENLLGKSILISRRKSFRHLVALYGLDESQALFHVLLRFAALAANSIPLLALVRVFCWDPQLRASFSLLEQTSPETVIPRRLFVASGSPCGCVQICCRPAHIRMDSIDLLIALLCRF